MNALPRPVVSSAVLPARLQERLQILGATVATLRADGCLTLINPSSAIESLLAAAPLVAVAAARQWGTLQEQPGQAIALWPGLHLVALPAERRRRASNRATEPLVVALLLTTDLPGSEELHRICDAAKVDWQATLAQLDPARLLSPAEASRLAAALAWMHQDAADLERHDGELQGLSCQLGESYEELSLLYKLSTNLSVDQDPAAFLTEACRELQQVAGLRWMALQLIDSDPRLNELAGRTFTAGPVDADASILRRIGQELIQRQGDVGYPMVIDDAATLNLPHLSRLTKSLLVVRLWRDKQPLGILFGGDKLDGTHISSVDSKLCNSLASSLAMFLENMMLFEDMQSMFLGTLHALTSSIDAKDAYTRGHSERVAWLSKQLALAAGLDAHQAERVYLSGLLHDVGKIGVPEAVLCKPGKLTLEEFTLIKSHPGVGGRILRDIRQMRDLVPGVLHHHERWDGKGYPSGLAGENVPVFGRIICLADAFDAMSSNRTYRQAMDPQRVLDEIRRCAGTQFDPRLAELFLGLDLAPFYDLVHRHQQQAAAPAAEAIAS